MKEYNNNFILESIVSKIDKDYRDAVDFIILENSKSVPYDSIVIKTRPSIWFNCKAYNYLLARIKLNGNFQYISFPGKLRRYIIENNIKYNTVKSDDFLRIEICYFLDNIDKPEFCNFINTAFFKSFSFEPFGCCHKYKDCTQLHTCLHDDKIYSLACQYRKIIK